MQEIDQRDRELITALQSDIPVASTPFAIVGQMIDMSEKEVIKRAERLRRDGLLRQITGVFDGRSLGYKSSLVAAKVDSEKIDRAASVINLHPGVTQNYKRNHDFNLWFTITVPSDSQLGLEKTVSILAREAGCDVVRLLPTIRLFKGAVPEGSDAGDNEQVHAPAESLSAKEIAAVKLLQGDIPIQPRPFDALARGTEFTPEELLAIAQGLKKSGVMRRFAAILQQRKTPFTTTAMGVWAVPEADVERVGQQMAAHKAVVQCYLRPIYEDWPYNLFTTVQGRSVDECDATLNSIASETGITAMRALYPTKEYKRSRLQYFTAEIPAWEASHPGSSSQPQSAAQPA